MVYPWTIDHVGHMNVQFYTARFDEASWHFLLKVGFAPASLKAESRAFVAARQETRYFAEVLAGSLLHIESELLEVKAKTLRYRHRMYNSETGAEVSSMELVIIYIDTQVRRSYPLPRSPLLEAAMQTAGVQKLAE